MNCPTCSRSSDDCRFIGDFCEFCTMEKVKRTIPEGIGIEQCRLCTRIRLSGTYHPMTNDTLSEAVGAQVRLDGWTPHVENYKDRTMLVRFSYGSGRNPISFEKEMKVRITHRTCMDCFRRTSGYYEAVVQLRGAPEKVKAELQRMVKFIERSGAFISKTEPKDTGIDVYMSSKLVIEAFFAKRKQKPKKSYTLYGMKKDKKVYRNTYFLTL